MIIEQEILVAYAAGTSITELSKKFHLTKNKIRTLLINNGTAIRYSERHKPQNRTPENIILELYANGGRIREISRDYNVSRDRIRRILADSKIPPRSLAEARRQYTWNENAFSAVNAESAYWTGFLMGDGTINKRKTGSPTVCLTLATKDKTHVEKFKTFLKTDKPLLRVEPRNNSGGYNLTITCNKLVADLAKFGVTPNKMYTAKVVGLENSPDFFRGLVDADGCIRIEKGFPSLSCTGAKPLMNQFLTFIKTVLPTCSVHLSKVKRAKAAYTILLHGWYITPLLVTLYQNARIYLDRKAETALQVIAETARRSVSSA